MIKIINLKGINLEKQIAVFSVPQQPNWTLELDVEDGIMCTTLWSGPRGSTTRARLMVDARAQGRELKRIFRMLSSDHAAESARARLCELAAIGLRSCTEIKAFYARVEKYAREKAAAQAAKDARGSARVSKLAA